MSKKGPGKPGPFALLLKLVKPRMQGMGAAIATPMAVEAVAGMGAKAAPLAPLAAPAAQKATELVQQGPAVQQEAQAAKSAYDIAMNGGKYAGQLRQFLSQGVESLQKSVGSFSKLIEQHQSWIKDPSSKVANWSELSPQHQQNLLHHWGQDVQRAQAYKEMAERVVQEKINN